MRADSAIGQVQALLQMGRIADAAQLLSGAAREGDAEAMFELAHWSISGDIIPRDLAAARGLFGRAGAAGHEDAALLHAYFMASETGGEADWVAAVESLSRLVGRSPHAHAQIELIDLMDLDERGFPARMPQSEPLSLEPHASTCSGFLSDAECRYLCTVGAPYLQPSMVIDDATGRPIPHPIRKSDCAVFGVHTEDLVVSAINRRIAALTGTEYRQGEPLQLLRYHPGGEYRAHMDALPAETNQRILTVIVYLNDGYEGGETIFPRTGVSFRGKTGDALIFDNVTAAGSPDLLATHAGAPVSRGVKHIATRWIRAQPFTYPPPTPILKALVRSGSTP